MIIAGFKNNLLRICLFFEGYFVNSSPNVTGNLLNERKDLSANVNLTICAVFEVTEWEITKNERDVAMWSRRKEKPAAADDRF